MSKRSININNNNMAGIILLEAVESLQPSKQSVAGQSAAVAAANERNVSLVDLGKKLLDASRDGDTDEVRNLMTNGAPFTTDWLGTSPLHMAAQYGHLSTAEVLLRAGISRDAKTKVDRTPLHVAAQAGHLNVVDLLIRNGADIDAKDMLRMTPLHWAVERGHISIIEQLLVNGADATVVSKFDKTPVAVALDNGRLDLVHLLTTGEAGKRPTQSETDASAELIAAHNEESELLAAAEDAEDETTEMQVQANSSASTVRPILLHANLANIANIVKREGKNSDSEEVSIHVPETGDQSSTSVLATLAALAETMGPLTARAGNSVSAAETLQWLEQHGITMLPGDNSTIITSALEGGQTISLTEAGKLALNFSKRGTGQTANKVDVSALEKSLENVVANMSNQKVITIVTDQSQLPSLMAGGATGPFVVAMTNSDTQSTDDVINMTLNSTKLCEPKPKRPRKMSLKAKDTSGEDLANLDRDQLARRLEEAERKAKDYERQLMVKAHEAEEYKKKLDSLDNSSTTAQNSDEK